MFVRNAWYCAGWDYDVSQGREVLVERLIAGERVVLYRRPEGPVVAMEDRCPHRRAPLSLGRKEGNSIRCLHHGMRFSPGGALREDAVMLEGQWQRLKERPDGNKVNIIHDTGPGKLLHVLDTLLKQEARERRAAAE